VSCLILSVCLLAAAGPGPARAGLRPECGNPMPGSVLTDSPWPEPLNMRFVGSWPFGEPYAVTVDTARALAFCGSGAGVMAIDIADPTSPTLRSDAIRCRELVRKLAYNHADSTLFLSAQGRTVLWDVGNVESPSYLATLDIQSSDFVVAGTLCFVCNDRDFVIYDVSDPSNPARLGSCSEAGARDMAVADSLVFLGAGWLLKVVSVADPTQPTVVGVGNLRADVAGLVVEGSWVYSAGWDERGRHGILCIDVSDPSEPRLDYIEYCEHSYRIGNTGQLLVLPSHGPQVFDISSPGRPSYRGCCRAPVCELDICLWDSLMFAASVGWESYQHGLWAFEISDPSNPAVVSRYATPHKAGAVAKVGPFALLAGRRGGIRILDLSDMANPEEVNVITSDDESYDVAVEGALAYVADGNGGLRIFDISNPLEPDEIGSLSLTGTCRGVDLHDTLAFVATVGRGLYIVDVADPAHPEIVANWDSTPYVRATEIQGHYAFLAAGEGMHVLDISDPSAPRHVGQYEYESYDGRDVAVRNCYAWVAFCCSGCGAGGLGTLDISDPADPHPVDTMYWHASDETDLQGDYLFLTGREVGVFDITDPANPELVASHALPYWESEDRGQCVDGNLVFCACADKGLHIYEATGIDIKEREATSPPAGFCLLENPVFGNAIRLGISAPSVSGISIYNSTGRLVGEHAVVQGRETRIPTRGLAAGTYFLRANGGNAASSLKALLPD